MLSRLFVAKRLAKILILIPIWSFIDFSLEAQIENIRQKMQLDKDLAICNKKLTWMQFEELFLKYRETEEDLKKAKE